MSDREKILAALMDVLGEEGCGVSCEEATIFMDDEGWKMMPLKRRGPTSRNMPAWDSASVKERPFRPLGAALRASRSVPLEL
jgi:hypothetical protein